MALAWTKVAETTLNNKYLKVYTVAFDSSYPTGGESYVNSDVGMAGVPDVMMLFPYKGFLFEWDSANKKIKAYAVSVAGGAASAGTDALSIKSGALAKESAGAATVGLVEAQSTADLSALTAVPVIVIGSHSA